jgi:hypothetical protein
MTKSRLCGALVLSLLAAAFAKAEPSRAAWLDKDPAQWPQILLQNDAHFKDNTVLTGASGFLVRLPNGAVVAATAAHVFGDTKADALESSLSSWTMHPRTLAQKRVTLGKLAITTDAASATDCLLINVAPARPWPVEVLPLRQKPAEIGETVYLIALPYDDHSGATQQVYKGKVIHRDRDNEFGYSFSPSAQTRGFSGAPVIDADGFAIGVHHGKYNDQPGDGAILAVANDLVVAAKSATAAPAPPKSKPVATSTPAATAPAATAAAASPATPPPVSDDQHGQELPLLPTIRPGAPQASEARRNLSQHAGRKGSQGDPERHRRKVGAQRAGHLARASVTRTRRISPVRRAPRDRCSTAPPNAPPS